MNAMSTTVASLPPASLQASDAVRRSQSAKARAVRLERLARRVPEIRALLNERNAQAEAVEELRRKLATVEAQHAALAAEASRLAAENADLKQKLEVAHTQLAAALKPKSR